MGQDPVRLAKRVIKAYADNGGLTMQACGNLGIKGEQCKVLTQVLGPVQTAPDEAGGVVTPDEQKALLSAGFQKRFTAQFGQDGKNALRMHVNRLAANISCPEEVDNETARNAMYDRFWKLVKIGPDASPAIPSLMAALNSCRPSAIESYRNYATFPINALAAIGTAAIPPLLNQLNNSPDPWLKSAALAAFGEMLRKNGQNKTIIDNLIHAMENDTSPIVKVEAAKSLKKPEHQNVTDTDKVIVDAYVRVLNTPQANYVHYEIIHILAYDYQVAGVLPSAAVDVLLARLKNELKVCKEENGCYALGNLVLALGNCQAAEKAIPELESILMNRNFPQEIRQRSALALGKIAKNSPDDQKVRVVDILTKALETNHEYVRSDTLSAIEEIGIYPDDTVSAIHRMARSDSDQRNKKFAQRVLDEIARRQGLK